VYYKVVLKPSSSTAPSFVGFFFVFCGERGQQFGAGLGIGVGVPKTAEGGQRRS
jgi:hypothetical protein